MGFVQEQRGDTTLFTIPSFSATGLVEHGFTCRWGGISRGAFDSLNLAFHVGDDPIHVLKNRNQVVKSLGAALEDLVAAEQVHGRTVFVVEKQDKGRGSDSMVSAIPQADALVTNVPGVMLSLYYADCVPVFFLDPEKKAVALAHAGWKGTVQQIVCETMKCLRDGFGSDPRFCLAAIGPAIGPCCFCVDRPVFEQFARTFEYYRNFCRSDGEEKWVIDLPQANYEQLIRSGVKPENITVSNLCTACSSDTFFSYRKDNGQTGRQASLIMLKEGEL